MSATSDDSTVVISLEGTFDLPSARLLENSLKRMGGNRVRVDFTHVREFNDFAVAVLAQTLKRQVAVDTHVEGLRLHQVRLLRYFGVDAAVFRPEAPPSR